MTNEKTAIAVKQNSGALANFASADGFELIQRISKAFSESDLVPTSFKGKPANCIIGVELAHRIGASPLMVMQNLDIIHGRPSWRSQFIISAINACGKFSPVRFKVTGEGDQKTCVAYANELATGELLEGPPVSIEMAKKEGWYSKQGSKWQTMPDLMLRYRAAAFFGRLYAPEILMGMQTVEEQHEIGPDTAKDITPPVASDLNAEIKKAAKSKKATGPVIDAEPLKQEPATDAPNNGDYF